MAVEFPLGTKTIVFGRVADPVIPLLVQTRHGFVPFDFLVDTGADCTMLPASIAETELGIRLSRCPQETFFGIEGRGIRVYRSALTIKLGPHVVRLRCAFSSHEHSPLILGRLDLFSHFTLTFDNRRHLVRFTTLAH